MATDSKDLTEEERNRQRQVQLENAAEDNGGVIDTVEDAFETVLDPLVTEEVDEEDIARRRLANDQDTRDR